ncbi:MAG: type toxin-antitoxin system mRNA interferase toxin, RelE/StbE family [Devosia sp.]|nr:type toxin-antitoxin system mRNA interferase toxin, RelE/StbE family [Devosia sp.]
MNLRWTRAARRDRESIYAFFEAEQPEAALRLDERFGERANQLTEFPQLGRTGRMPDTRELSIPGSSYLLVYRVEIDLVWIVRVLHTARAWPEKD